MLWAVIECALLMQYLAWAHPAILRLVHFILPNPVCGGEGVHGKYSRGQHQPASLSSIILMSFPSLLCKKSASLLDEGIVILGICLLLCDHVGIIVGVVILRCIGLAGIDFVVIIPVEGIRSAEAIKARLPLDSNLHEGIMTTKS